MEMQISSTSRNWPLPMPPEAPKPGLVNKALTHTHIASKKSIKWLFFFANPVHSETDTFKWDSGFVCVLHNRVLAGLYWWWRGAIAHITEEPNLS